MTHHTTERWRKLCKQASTEIDPEKLAKLLKELANILAENPPAVNKNE
jgi:hypothetical protein